MKNRFVRTWRIRIPWIGRWNLNLTADRFTSFDGRSEWLWHIWRFSFAREAIGRCYCPEGFWLHIAVPFGQLWLTGWDWTCSECAKGEVS